MTVLFCDLVGYAALSEKLDPEELRNLVRAYQQVCTEVVDRFEGHVAQYLGDGLLIYFGYPRAHEDDPQRAVKAGLRMAKAVDRLNSRLALTSEIRLAVRIGIHTGAVVVGDLGTGDNREQLALGNTPNIASRLEQISDPGAVVIGEKTFRLTRKNKGVASSFYM